MRIFVEVCAPSVELDIRKVDARAHRQEEVEAQIRRTSVRYITSEERRQNGAKGVAQWLALDCSRRPTPIGQKLRYRFALYAPVYLRLTAVAGRILPRFEYFRLGRRIGRLSRTSN
jgi:hypothetical protein